MRHKHKGNKTLEGRIELIQEERFRLITKAGRAYLLDLAHDSPTTVDDLQEWYRSGAIIRVEYEGEPNQESGIAHQARAC
ncbi:MAG: hypothetical protein C4576_00150 [Desulfobacteraceae bacterium]|nr:MAG: hypothetical protein C4576_00150 [Desulfobacteraceae bacterium]